MKKILFITAITVSSFAIMNAQNNTTTTTTTISKGTAAQEQKKSAAVKAKENVAQITTLCSLKGDQIGKVNDLFTDYYTKLETLKADKALSSDEINKKKVEMRKKRDAALKEILTPAQWKTFSEAAKKK